MALRHMNVYRQHGINQGRPALNVKKLIYFIPIYKLKCTMNESCCSDGAKARIEVVEGSITQMAPKYGTSMCVLATKALQLAASWPCSRKSLEQNINCSSLGSMSPTAFVSET